MTLNRTEVIGAVVLILQLGCGYALAEAPITLAELVNVARRACLQPSNSGGSESAQLAAETSGSLPKLLGPVMGARIGASLNGQVQRYDGPLQKDQASDRASYRTCVEFFIDRASRRYSSNSAKIAFTPLLMHPGSRHNIESGSGPKQSNTALPANMQPAKTPSSGDQTASNLGSCAGRSGIIVTNSTFSGVGTAYSVTPDTKLCTDKNNYDNVNKVLEIK
jgi:hypothetical protein